jgi:hypothetical protein
MRASCALPLKAEKANHTRLEDGACNSFTNPGKAMIKAPPFVVAITAPKLVHESALRLCSCNKPRTFPSRSRKTSSKSPLSAVPNQTLQTLLC